MVRRPSGGGAVLHGGGLTYALIWPHPPRQRREAYRRVNAWISSGLARLGLELHPGDDPALAGSQDCFASATTADLVDPLGHKRIGSAQFWQRGHLLQHGEIPLAPSQQLWEDVFGAAPPCWQPTAPSAARVEAALTEAIAELWPGLRWCVTPIKRSGNSSSWRNGLLIMRSTIQRSHPTIPRHAWTSPPGAAAGRRDSRFGA